MRNELPQAFIELVFGLVFSFAPFVIFAVFTSLVKVVGIPVVKTAVGEFILIRQWPAALAAWRTANGDGAILGMVYP